MWQTLKNPVGAQGLYKKVTVLTKNLLKGDRNSLQNLLKGDHNSPLQKKIRVWINKNPNLLFFA